MKRLDLVVGPNGAGKTTFVERQLGPLLPGSVFVNADVIAAAQWPADHAAHSYEAARVAAATRTALLDVGRSFIAETVFSHPSKLELLTAAQSRGYIVVLHVLLIPEALAVARVRYRVAAGGHAVPEDKIRQRHRRLWPLVATAMTAADSALVYDGSRVQGPRIIAQLSRGDVIGAVAWPDWAPDELRNRWPA